MKDLENILSNIFPVLKLGEVEKVAFVVKI